MPEYLRKLAGALVALFFLVSCAEALQGRDGAVSGGFSETGRQAEDTLVSDTSVNIPLMTDITPETSAGTVSSLTEPASGGVSSEEISPQTSDAKTSGVQPPEESRTAITGPIETEPAETAASSTESAGTETSAAKTDAPAASETIRTEASTKATAAEQTIPEDVAVPEIKNASSPGLKVFENEYALLDVSNASDGYISVKYKGDSPGGAKLRVSFGDSSYPPHDVNASGRTEYFPLSLGDGEYTVEIFEHVSGGNYLPVMKESVTASGYNNTKNFLFPNEYVKFSRSSDAAALAARLCYGKESELEKISSVFIYITDNISYDKAGASSYASGYVPDPDRTLRLKKGICFDYASLFSAMTRAQGIPSRLVVGYASPEIYHAWNEVYTEETGWIAVEFYLRSKGFNLLDATFYSSNDDKKEISDYISDRSNYYALYIY